MRRRSIHPFLAAGMALKGLRRSPGTTLLATVILAMGLAFPATFFSLLVGAIRPLPVPEGNRVVRVDAVSPARGGAAFAPTADDVRTLSSASSLEGIGAFSTFAATMIDRRSAATRVSVAEVTDGVFPLLRVSPTLGRIPSASDGGSGLLLGHDVFADVYGSDPEVLGRVVEVDGRPRTIVGVMPEGFGFPFKQDAWIVAGPEGPAEPLELIGRLADGASLESSSVELGGLWTQSDALRPPERQGAIVTVEGFTGSRGETGEAIAFIGLVLVALCLLLIACANVANLLLVRASDRLRALGIQSALGAGRGQIGAQLFLEALLIAAAGGTVGLAIAWGLVDAIEAGLGAMHWGYFWMRMAIDARVLLFTAVLIVGTALVAGTLPVARVLRTDVQRVLKEEAGASSMGGEGAWGRGFVTLQLALSCAALVAAGLAGRSLGTSNDFARDIPSEEILVSSVSFADREGRGDLPEVVFDLLSRLEAEPDTRFAAVANGVPAFRENRASFELDGELRDRPEDLPRTGWTSIAGDYFETLDIALLAGRRFSSADVADSEPVALVNQSFVQRFSPDADVIGRRIRTAPGEDQWRTIVGVVADGTSGGARARHDRVYVPWRQALDAELLILTRASGDAAGLAPVVRRTLASTDPSVPIDSQQTLAEGYAFLIRLPRVMAGFALSGGLAGLLISAVGLYGLLAYRIRQRRRELGVRLALGADGARLARETIVLALWQIVPAVVVGLSAAWLASPVLNVLLLGTDPRGASTYVFVGGTFLGVGLIASALPAMRAAGTDPARVLRGS